MSATNVKRVKSSEIELKDRLVGVNRVTKVTKGGRAFTFAAIVVVSIVGFLLYGLVGLAERYLIPWHISQRRTHE